MNSAVVTLSAEQIAFLQGNVVIYAATADKYSTPHVARASGCRIDAAQSTVTIFLKAAEAAALLTDMRAKPSLAVVFCEPGTEKAIQLKANDARIAAMQADDRRLLADYCKRLTAHIVQFGFSVEMLRAFFSMPGGDAVALQFTPITAFDQTPGPHAGMPLMDAI